jgi:S-adenosylmethionine:tRNA ribosyltransferase-isomerase
VLHARIFFQKSTGGKIEVFCLEPDQRYDVSVAMKQTEEVYWKCLVGGAAKWKNGQVLSTELSFEIAGKEVHLKVWAEQVSRHSDFFLLKFRWTADTPSALSFSEVLYHSGNLPIPPYLHRESEPSDEVRYQTIFARDEGSVAAPTAALHFTPEIMENLATAGIKAGLLTLHVGAGTFKPVKSEYMKDHDMHAEWMEIPIDFIRQLLSQKSNAKPVVAVGTTSARSIESLYWIGAQLLDGDWDPGRDIAVPQWYPYTNHSDASASAALAAVIDYLVQKGLNKIIARTQIMIAPGYDYKVIDGLVTNFHQPQSTLLLLVAAMIGDAWRLVYDYALHHDFRFLSYGDGCLLWRTDAGD